MFANMTREQMQQLEQMRFTHATIEVDLSAPKHQAKTNGIPLWAMVSLGGRVRLTRPVDEYGDASTVHPAGKVGKLDAIQSNPQKRGDPRGLVEFPDGDLVAIPFDSLEAA